jgi:hypothetical protein
MLYGKTMRRAQDFVAGLHTLSFDHTFNPYVHRCPVHDKVDAPQRRSRALENMLDVATRCEIDSIWIGRDLGYRGGRRTGLALTDDVHIACHAFRWGIDLDRPTKGAPIAERTAAVIWSVLEEIRVPIFLWNVFPLHPHEPDNPFTNRSHNAKERKVGEEVLAELVRLLSPKRVVAIGNDAAKSLSRIAASESVLQIRHPSYGGQTEFFHQIRTIYGDQRRVAEARAWG